MTKSKENKCEKNSNEMGNFDIQSESKTHASLRGKGDTQSFSTGGEIETNGES